MMSIAARLDHPFPPAGPFRPLGIAVMVLGFIFFWPVGVATLAFLIWSGRMGCWHHAGEHGFAGHNWQERMEARRARWEQKWAARCGAGRSRSSGNRAFDAYRDDTLRRLEEEEKEFREFLDRLRFAKDKSEFDDFLANRRPPAQPPAVSETH
jgi:hypothetical protein